MFLTEYHIKASRNIKIKWKRLKSITSTTHQNYVKSVENMTLTSHPKETT
jgi:hypothetical protein